MEHVAALMLIVGCSDGMAQCDGLQDRMPLFETATACRAAIMDEIIAHVGARPYVLGHCIDVDPAIPATGWSVSWTVSAAGVIEASADPVRQGRDVVVASLSD